MPRAKKSTTDKKSRDEVVKQDGSEGSAPTSIATLTPTGTPTIPPVATEPTSPTLPPTTEPVPTGPHGLPVVYDKLDIIEYSITSDHGALTPDDMKTLLGWETEKEYQARMVAEQPDSKPEHWLYGDVYHCLDTSKQKVRCWNNANNRPFDMSWCEDLIHTILEGQWAGPLTVPGETINGETIRISRYGRVLSGQHQGTALILANEMLQKSREQESGNARTKYPFWIDRDHCVLETIVVFGLSEDERVLRTIDYVKPRTTADMLYTMELFRNNTPAERKEMTRMLASAINLLWDRTDTKGYKTHPEIVGFLERHRRLMKCVEHLFIENKAQSNVGGRRITSLHVSAGDCAALCYLMGSSGPKTDGDVYRNENPPSERNLDWSYWDRAREFWARLAGDRAFVPVRTALGRLIDSSPGDDFNQGLGGRRQEKFAILSKAWDRWKDLPESAGAPFTAGDIAPDGYLTLSYIDLDDQGNKMPDGQVKLLDSDDFNGIDCPESVGRSRSSSRAAPMPPAPSHEEIEKATAEALERRAGRRG